MFTLPSHILKRNLVTEASILNILCKIVSYAEEYAYKEKLELNSVDFSDVELFAENLLIEDDGQGGYKRTALAEEIRSNHIYEIIMIDEFQDVNNMQELIFRAISDSDDVSIMGKNIFVVGDVKQAIYKFRLTNPKLFVKCRKQAEDVKNKENLEAVYLKKNFRSRPEIVNFVNFVFRNIMSEKAGSVNYDDNEKLEQGASYSEGEVPVEVMLIKSKDDTPVREKRGFSDENILVAKRIKDLIDNGETVYKNGKNVPCTAKDFCILVQKNDEINAMARALEYVGLHANTENTSGYMTSTEIVFVLNILRVIDNPLNDIALVGVLLSHIDGMDFTPDDLAVLKLKNKQQNKFDRSFFKILLAVHNEQDEKKSDDEKSLHIELEDENLRNKCKKAYEFIDTLRFYSRNMSAENLLRKIYDITDIKGIMSVYPDSRQKAANLNLLIEYAKSYEKENNENISGFLKYIDSVSANEKAFANAVINTNNEDTVTIKTYHKSKGLEFPFVFLCELHSKITSSKKPIYLDNEEGACFQLLDNDNYIEFENPYYDYLKKHYEDEELSEKIRLFYVGCTRAKEKLFLSYSLKLNKGKKFENEIKKQRDIAYDVISKGINETKVLECENMLSWLTMVLAKYPANIDFLNFIGLNGCKTQTDKSAENVSIDFYTCEFAEQENSETENKAEIVVTSDKETAGKLEEKLKYQYNNKYSETPLKTAVTEIVKREKEKENKNSGVSLISLPELDNKNGNLTNAEKGTCTHKFMEVADYDNAEISVDSELERLCNEGFFTQKEAKGVYKDRLKKFFESDFYRRMKKSEKIYREKNFLVAVKDIDLPEKYSSLIGAEEMIQGIADCIFKEDDGYVIVDYKTDNFKNEDEMNKYTTQLAVYKAAFEFLFNDKIKGCYIYSFWLNKEKEISV